MAQNKYLNLTGLQTYDVAIKQYIDGKEYDDSALKALHADKTGEGVAEGTKMTVAEEAAAEVAKVVANAPDAFDTLKEIAEWIQKDGEDGFDAANRITTLETKVGKEAVAAQGIEGEEGYVPAQDATGLIADVRALEEAAQNADTYIAITTDEINALFEEEINDDDTTI